MVVESDPSQLTQLMINGISLSVTTLTSIGVLDKVKENLSKRKNELLKLSSYTDKAFNELSNILDDVAIHYKAIDIRIKLTTVETVVRNFISTNPTFLLLLDTAHLCQLAGDTQCVAKQNQFNTESGNKSRSYRQNMDYNRSD